MNRLLTLLQLLIINKTFTMPVIPVDRYESMAAAFLFSLRKGKQRTSSQGGIKLKDSGEGNTRYTFADVEGNEMNLRAQEGTGGLRLVFGLVCGATVKQRM